MTPAAMRGVLAPCNAPMREPSPSVMINAGTQQHAVAAKTPVMSRPIPPVAARIPLFLAMCLMDVCSDMGVLPTW